MIAIILNVLHLVDAKKLWKQQWSGVIWSIDKCILNSIDKFSANSSIHLLHVQTKGTMLSAFSIWNQKYSQAKAFVFEYMLCTPKDKCKCTSSITKCNNLGCYDIKLP